MKELFVLSMLLVVVTANNFYDNVDVGDFFAESQARTFYFNASNTATSVTLLSIYLMAGLIAYLLYTGYALSPQSNANFNRVQFNDFAR